MQMKNGGYLAEYPRVLNRKFELEVSNSCKNVDLFLDLHIFIAKYLSSEH